VDATDRDTARHDRSALRAWGGGSGGDPGKYHEQQESFHELDFRVPADKM
jgi:hypothetical protein